MANDSLINLAQFRKINKIKQKELAKLLNATTSFLSLVETGKSKLSDSKIDKILDEAQKKNWDISDFNPTYYRLNFIAQIAQEAQNMNHTPIDWNTGENAWYISKSEILHIKHGKEISQETAQKIKEQNPIYNLSWIMTGEGDPYEETPEENNNKNKFEIILNHLQYQTLY